MIAETDWELGLPPYGVPVEAFIRGQVRHGKRDFMDTFRVDDCTHPMQNTTLPLDWVDGWRYNEAKEKDREMIIGYRNAFREIFNNTFFPGINHDTSIA